MGKRLQRMNEKKVIVWRFIHLHSLQDSWFMTSVELFSNDDVLALEVIMKHLRNVCYVVSEDWIVNTYDMNHQFMGKPQLSHLSWKSPKIQNQYFFAPKMIFDLWINVARFVWKCYKLKRLEDDICLSIIASIRNWSASMNVFSKKDQYILNSPCLARIFTLF